MKQFLLILIVSIFTLSGAAWIARATGSLSPEAGFAALFYDAAGQPCPMPCLLGIRPGEMYFTTADRLIRQHPFVKDMILSARSYGAVLELCLPDATINLISDWNGKVQSISLSHYARNNGCTVVLPADVVIPPDSLGNRLGTMGNLIERFGPPSKIQFSLRESNPIRLYFASQNIMIKLTVNSTVNGAHLNTDDAIEFLAVSQLDSDTYEGMMMNGTHWRGFSSLTRYMQAAR